MRTEVIDNRDSACRRAERLHDVLLISSFGLWALLIGLSPVLAFRLFAS